LEEKYETQPVYFDVADRAGEHDPGGVRRISRH
jgi:hypothetical protein